MKLVSLLIIAVLTLLLYRKIETIGKISVLLWVGLLFTFAWIIYGGFTNSHIPISFLPEHPGDFLGAAFWVAIGQGSVKTIYCFLGYYNVCHLGGEIRNPEKNIPQSIFISITCICLLYFALNLSITSVIPWQEVEKFDFVVSIFIEKIYGHTAAKFATLLILWIAFASLFAVLLGYSRIPYAAAEDGNFFSFFARLHPTKKFPYMSLLFIAGLAMLFSMAFNLKQIISAILAMRILTQFIAQAIGVIFIRSRTSAASRPFKMWLYPLPIVVTIFTWLFVFFSTGWYALYGSLLAACGLLVYQFRSKAIKNFK